MKFLSIKINSKLLLTIYICFVSLITTTGIIILTHKEKDNMILYQEPKKEYGFIKLKEDLIFEINSEVSLLSLIENKNVDILTDDELIDTSILGEKEITIEYIDNLIKKEYKFNIVIVDTIAPIIEANDNFETIVGT